MPHVAFNAHQSLRLAAIFAHTEQCNTVHLFARLLSRLNLSTSDCATELAALSPRPSANVALTERFPPISIMLLTQFREGYLCLGVVNLVAYNVQRGHLRDSCNDWKGGDMSDGWRTALSIAPMVRFRCMLWLFSAFAFTVHDNEIEIEIELH
jgi:hypothetical protein